MPGDKQGQQLVAQLLLRQSLTSFVTSRHQHREDIVPSIVRVASAVGDFVENKPRIYGSFASNFPLRLVSGSSFSVSGIPTLSTNPAITDAQVIAKLANAFVADLEA
jgi:hypothetical protein